MNKLEKVLEHLINDDQEKAEALLHEFIVERAKQVHRSIIAEAEGEDDFMDADSLGDDAEYAEDDLTTSLTGDDEGEVEGEVEGEAEEDSEEDDLEDRIEDMEGTVADLESQLAELSAAFDELNAIEAEEHEGEEVKESDDADEDDFSDADFSDLEESLKPVSFDATASKEVGAGGKPVNGKGVSPVATGKSAPHGVEVRGPQHKGFDREPSPAVKKTVKADNSHDSADYGRSAVSSEGDKSALLNSKKGFGSDNGRSPVPVRK